MPRGLVLCSAEGNIASGTAQAATSTTLQLASAESFAADEIIGATVDVDHTGKLLD